MPVNTGIPPSPGACAPPSPKGEGVFFLPPLAGEVARSGASGRRGRPPQAGVDRTWRQHRRALRGAPSASQARHLPRAAGEENLSPPFKPVRHFSRLPGREARAQSLVPGGVRSLSARGGDIPSSGRAIARGTRHKVTTVLAPRRFRCVARKGRRSNLRVRETCQVTHTHYEIRPVRSLALLSYRQAETPWR